MEANVRILKENDNDPKNDKNKIRWFKNILAQDSDPINKQDETNHLNYQEEILL